MSKKAVVWDRFLFRADGLTAHIEDTTTGDGRSMVVDKECEYDDMRAIERLVVLANIGARYVRGERKP